MAVAGDKSNGQRIMHDLSGPGGLESRRAPCGSAVPAGQEQDGPSSNLGAHGIRTNATARVASTFSGILSPASRAPPCPREGLSPSDSSFRASSTSMNSFGPSERTPGPSGGHHGLPEGAHRVHPSVYPLASRSSRPPSAEAAGQGTARGVPRGQPLTPSAKSPLTIAERTRPRSRCTTRSSCWPARMDSTAGRS